MASLSSASMALSLPRPIQARRSGGSDVFYYLTRHTIRASAMTLCRPTITGLEHIPPTGPFIVAANHLSFLDSVLIPAILPRRVAYFAKAEYFTQKGVKGWMMRSFFEAVRAIPVDRGEQSASVAALKSLVDLLEAGNGVGIYPEGTRSRDGRLYRGRTGVGWLALTTGAPVLPVGLQDTDKLQPPGSNRIRPKHFSVHVGAPLHFKKIGSQHPPAQRRRVTDEIVDAIADLSGQERAPEYNRHDHGSS